MGLGPIGNNQSRGFLLHTALAVIPGKYNPEIPGIAMQEAWRREDKIHKGNKTKHQRRQRKTEGDIWEKTMMRIDKGKKMPSIKGWVIRCFEDTPNLVLYREIRGNLFK